MQIIKKNNKAVNTLQKRGCFALLSNRFILWSKKMGIKKEEVKNIYLSALSNSTPGSTFFTSSTPNVRH